MMQKLLNLNSNRPTTKSFLKIALSSSSAFNHIPLEILDIILQKSYLHWILYSPTKRTDDDVIRSLISVDVCFNRRITKHRFKKAIWCYLKDVYDRTKRRSAIIRNNRNYLLENIQPNEELIALLLSLNCITDEQSRFIHGQRSQRDKNEEILYLMKSSDETSFSNVVKCLRHTNQKAVTRVVENGGVVIKVVVQSPGSKYAIAMGAELLHRVIEDLRNRNKPRSHQTDKHISRLKDEDIEILNSQIDRHTVVVWIWCHSQAAIEYIQKMYESNQLRGVFSQLGDFPPSAQCAHRLIQSEVTRIDNNQFKRTVVTCPISINFTKRISDGKNEFICGVTKMRNRIYVLRISRSAAPHAIYVYQDLNPFELHLEIEIKEMNSPWDIGSSENHNCLYVSDTEETCIWKITTEAGNQHNIVKWLTVDFKPMTLSVSTDGQLLVLKAPFSILMIYGSDAELVRSILLPTDIRNPRHAVETSTGNIIIIHWLTDGKGNESSWKELGMTWVISELTRDGQMVIRRFVFSNEKQKLKFPWYMTLDSDDRVFVAEQGNWRVILMDSNMKWNRIVCPTFEEEAGRKEEDVDKRYFERMCYDDEKKQLIVGGDSHLGQGVNVYTLSRN